MTVGDKSSSNEQYSEQFTKYLYQAKEFLDNNLPHDAKLVLEKAHQLNPSHETARNLLGLTYFKLNQFEQAEQLFRQLLEENEESPTLRVNLAMLYIKQERFELAKEELEKATAADPNYQKARSYLGLVYSKIGWFAEAKEQFEAAGQQQMAEKMEQKLQQHPTHPDSTPQPPPSTDTFDDLSSTSSPTPELEETTSAETTTADTTPTDSPPPQNDAPPPLHDSSHPLEESLDLGPLDGFDPSLPPLPLHDSGPEMSVSLTLACSPLSLVEQDRQLFDSPHTFAITSDDWLVLQVQRRAYCRLQHLASVQGTPKIQPEFKHFQGKPTDRIFGDRFDPIYRIEENATILLLPTNNHQRTLLTLDEETIAYFREEALLGFGPDLQWENGRVPSKISPDLNLVNFWGGGEIILQTPSPLHAIQIQEDKPLRICFESMLGWIGSLVPNIQAEPDLTPAEQSPRAFIEFTGQGAVFLATPPNH